MTIPAVEVAVATIKHVHFRTARFGTAAALKVIAEEGRGRFPGGTDAYAVERLVELRVIRDVGGGYYEPHSDLIGHELKGLVVDDNGNLVEQAAAA